MNNTTVTTSGAVQGRQSNVGQSLSPDGILKTPRGSAGTKSPIKIPGTPLGSRGRSPSKEVRLSPTKSPAPDRFSPAPDHPSPDVEDAISKLRSLPKISPVPSAIDEDILDGILNQTGYIHKGKKARSPSPKAKGKSRTPSPRTKTKARTPSPKTQTKARSPSPTTKQIEVEKDKKG